MEHVINFTITRACNVLDNFYFSFMRLIDIIVFFSFQDCYAMEYMCDTLLYIIDTLLYTI